MNAPEFYKLLLDSTYTISIMLKHKMPIIDIEREYFELKRCVDFLGNKIQAEENQIATSPQKMIEDERIVEHTNDLNVYTLVLKMLNEAEVLIEQYRHLLLNGFQTSERLPMPYEKLLEDYNSLQQLWKSQHDQLKSINTTINQSIKNTAKVNDDNQKLEEKNKQLIINNAKLELNNRNLQDKVTELKHEINQQVQKNKDINQEKEMLTQNIDVLKKSNIKLSEQNIKLSMEYRDLNIKNEQLQTDYSASNNRLTELIPVNDNLVIENEKLAKNSQFLTEENQQLKKQLELFKQAFNPASVAANALQSMMGVLKEIGMVAPDLVAPIALPSTNQHPQQDRQKSPEKKGINDKKAASKEAYQESSEIESAAIYCKKMKVAPVTNPDYSSNPDSFFNSFIPEDSKTRKVHYTDLKNNANANANPETKQQAPTI